MLSSDRRVPGVILREEILVKCLALRHRAVADPSPVSVARLNKPAQQQWRCLRGAISFPIN